ncbi:MAG: GNAT family N-acetyltransferase [Caldilineaceae bacterium]
MTAITLLSHAEALAALDGLVEILVDSVNSGASVGFHRPMAVAEADAYWQDICADVGRGRVLLFAAYADGQLAGTAQLQPSPKPNGRNRAEVAKVLVHSAFRRRGIGRALMDALEAEARRLGRTTLVLDTRPGDAGEPLYAGCGYTRVGEIPAYVVDENGRPDATVFYYKLL